MCACVITFAFAIMFARTCRCVQPCVQLCACACVGAHGASCAFNLSWTCSFLASLQPAPNRARAIRLTHPAIHADTICNPSVHRLYEQLRVELKPHEIDIGSARPGVVATEGMLEHIRCAREAKLPHVQWFDSVLEKREDVPVGRVAAFMEFLLVGAGKDEFSEKEWHINDQTHWERWESGIVDEGS